MVKSALQLLASVLRLSPASLACAGVVIASFSIALPGCSPSTGVADGSPGAVMAPEEMPVLVRLGSWERGEVLDKLPVSADLEAVSRADVYPEIPGIVKEVLHREGACVKKGDPILLMVDQELQLTVQQKEILLAQAQAKVRQADLAAKEGKEVARQKELLEEKARREFERLKTLSEDKRSGIISEEQVDAKRFDYEEAQINASMAKLTGQKYEQEHAQAVENERLARVDLDNARYKLSQATLRSPIDGAISSSQVKPGELIGGSTKVFSVVDTSRLEARLHVPQRELARIRAGLPVRILCDVFPDKEFLGSVDVISPIVDKESGTVELLVGVGDPEGFLKPGMFINGEIILDKATDAVLVTKKALSYENQEAILYLVKGGVARRFVLSSGYSSRTHVQVLTLTGLDGLTLGAKEPSTLYEWAPVEIGHNNLKDGSRVQTEQSARRT